MKPFDKKFADNMRDVFDNWQETVDENAWLQMEQKLGGKTRKSAFVFLRTWSVKLAAAMLLGLLTFSVYYLVNLRETDFVLSQYDNPAEKSDTSNPGKEDFLQSIIENDNEIAAILPEPAESESEDEKRMSLYVKSTNSTNLDPGKKNDSIPDLPHKDFTNGNLTEPATQEEHLGIRLADGIPGESDTTHQEFETDHLAATFPSEADSFNDLTSNDSVLSVSPVVTEQMMDEQTIAANLLKMKSKNEHRSPNSYVEISAGSLKTYSSAELASGLGFSAGVMGHLAVSNKISLSSGGVLLYNQFTLDNPVAATGARNLDESFAMPDLANDSYSNTLYSVKSNYTDFEFTAIDIPLNVRFLISDRDRSQFFVSGGLSSLLYLQQNYTRYTEYATANSQLGLDGSQEMVTGNVSFSAGESYEAFRQFDFGRLINFSMGYLLKRERHSILIEPHIKYPIGNITSMNLRIGMAGISLKYNFYDQ
jgi:hypothetical protein